MKLEELIVRTRNEIPCPNCRNDDGISTGLICIGSLPSGRPKLVPCSLCRGATTVKERTIQEFAEMMQMQGVQPHEW